MLPKIIASSVIRSACRGESHGGLYVCDFNTNTCEQKLDWNYPNIDWESGGGDRGLRSVLHYNDLLYCSGAKELFVFNKQFELVKRFSHRLIDGTHTMALHNEQIYMISNQLDSILVFDLKREEFIIGYRYNFQEGLTIFDPSKHVVPRSDSMHLDVVTIHDNHMCISGSQTPFLVEINLKDYSVRQEQIFYVGQHGGSHNLCHYMNGLIYNIATRGETCFQKDKQVIIWKTPEPQKVDGYISRDFAMKNYTRGMALYENYIFVGTSPARIIMYDFNRKELPREIVISTDVKNSICGCSIYEW